MYLLMSVMSHHQNELTSEFDIETVLKTIICNDCDNSIEFVDAKECGSCGRTMCQNCFRSDFDNVCFDCLC